MPRSVWRRSLLSLLAVLLGPQAWAQRPLPRDPAILRYPEVPVTVDTDESFPLLFSNSPETPRQAGLLYRDVLVGRGRVLGYHANGLGRPARLLVVASSLAGRAVVTTERRGSAVTRAPDPVIGQRTLLRYFASAPLAPIVLASGEMTVLYSSERLMPGATASVMMDLGIDGGPLQIQVVLVEEGARVDGGRIALLPALERDERHQRGTFAGANRTLSAELSGLPARLTLAGQGDPPLLGVDALSGDPQRLSGNYGVLYRIELRGAQGSLLALSARGSRYRGALQVVDSDRRSLVLAGRGRALLDPALPAALWNPRGEHVELLFVPSNGSNLPVALVFYPREIDRSTVPPGP